MKRLFFVVTILMLSGLSYAATLSDAKILEAAKNIRYTTQKIAKNYLYAYIYPNHVNMNMRVQKEIESLEKDVRTIALNTNKTRIKGILDFIAYEKEQIKILLKTKPDMTTTNEVLDFSETVTEGAEKIAASVDSDFSFEEVMFLRTKDIEYLLEKLAMYYIILETDIDKTTIYEKLKYNIGVVESELEQIRQYSYPESFDEYKKDIFSFWDADKHYFSKIDTLKVPSIVVLSTSGMQRILKKFETHHAKGE